MKQKKEICHICKKEKKPYIVIMDYSIFSFLQYESAREEGPICERCDRYHAMTGEFRYATKEEFEIAKKSAWFARMMLRWWGKIEPDEDNEREWEGTAKIASWCREELSK